MEQVVIDGIDIQMTQNITSIAISHPHSIERTATGITWKGTLSLMVGDIPLRNRAIRSAIQENSRLTFDELNTASQDIYTKAYLELTIVEATQVDIVAVSGKLINGLVNGGFGITVDDISVLSDAIQSALTE